MIVARPSSAAWRERSTRCWPRSADSIARKRQLVADASPRIAHASDDRACEPRVHALHPEMQPSEQRKSMMPRWWSFAEMTHLIDELVELARAATRRARTHKRCVSISSRSRRSSSPAGAPAGVSPRRQCRDCQRRACRAHASDSRKNLLDNAVKWSSPDDPIDVTAAAGVCSVRDYGVGIAARGPAARLRSVLPRANARRSGSGLGLAIVRQSPSAPRQGDGGGRAGRGNDHLDSVPAGLSRRERRRPSVETCRPRPVASLRSPLRSARQGRISVRSVTRRRVSVSRSPSMPDRLCGAANDWLRLIAVAPQKNWYERRRAVTGDSSIAQAKIPARRLRDQARARWVEDPGARSSGYRGRDSGLGRSERKPTSGHGPAAGGLDALGAGSPLTHAVVSVAWIPD